MDDRIEWLPWLFGMSGCGLSPVEAWRQAGASQQPVGMRSTLTQGRFNKLFGRFIATTDHGWDAAFDAIGRVLWVRAYFVVWCR